MIPLFARLYLLVIGPSATLSDVITVLSCSVSFSLAWKGLPVSRPSPDFLPYLRRKWCTEVPWKIREIEGCKYAGIKIARLLATLFVICTSPIMHFLAPPPPSPSPPPQKKEREKEALRSISLGKTVTFRKDWNKKLCKILGRGTGEANKVYYGDVQMMNMTYTMSKNVAVVMGHFA